MTSQFNGLLERVDPVILERLAEVERLHLRGKSIRAIAAALDVSATTVFRDLERVRELADIDVLMQSWSFAFNNGIQRSELAGILAVCA